MITLYQGDCLDLAQDYAGRLLKCWEDATSYPREYPRILRAPPDVSSTEDAGQTVHCQAKRAGYQQLRTL